MTTIAVQNLTMIPLSTHVGAGNPGHNSNGLVASESTAGQVGVARDPHHFLSVQQKLELITGSHGYISALRRVFAN